MSTHYFHPAFRALFSIITDNYSIQTRVVMIHAWYVVFAKRLDYLHSPEILPKKYNSAPL
jgi:hypothetical protein